MSGVQQRPMMSMSICGRLFGSLARSWLRILSVALLVTGAAFAFAWLATPHYKAETQLLIETRESVFTRARASSRRATARCSTRKA